jgi:hypothetical protein
MWTRDTKANVVAVFENQDDADEAVLRLRLAGFRDRQIGYFGSHLDGTAEDLLERDHWFAGAVLGGVVGAALGVAAAPALAWLMAVSTGPHDLFGLSITCAVVGGLFVSFVGGWIGMSVSRRKVNVPATSTAAGSFVLAVSAGEARERALAIIHGSGGHETLPSAGAPHIATL